MDIKVLLLACSSLCVAAFLVYAATTRQTLEGALESLIGRVTGLFDRDGSAGGAIPGGEGNWPGGSIPGGEGNWPGGAIPGGEGDWPGGAIPGGEGDWPGGGKPGPGGVKPGGDEGGGGTGEWMSGKMSYYWGSESDKGYGTGNKGACDNQLRANKSIAVRQSEWSKYKGRRVEIQGVCTDCQVDDMCAGPCQELDMYTGNNKGGDGIKSVKYRFGDRIAGHPCL